MFKKILGFLLVVSIVLLSGCGPITSTQTATLTVFAASSLTDAFNDIGTAFSLDQPGVKVEFNFAGSQQLRTQLEQGATADVFASANTKEMNTAIASGLIVSGTQQTFLHNRLIVILPKNNPANIQSLQDLAKPSLKIILAAPSVPVGGYALTALGQMNADFGTTFSATVVSNVVSYEDNVKQVVAKIQLGEGDAGIVYSSDVTPAAAPQLSTIEIPDKYNVLATYPIAVLKAAPHSQLAAAFVDYVLSDKGQSILHKWGFLPK
jgi:molybdate transport system substrate-binding protein